MNLGKMILRGAVTQFGREFGRAGANKILKGSNYYGVKNINNNGYDGRIKHSDSEIVKSIKEIKKIEFITTDKGNILRLIKLITTIRPFIKFDGRNTLGSEFEDFSYLIKIYNEKYKQGKILISSKYSGKDLDYLNNEDKEIDDLINKFNSECKKFVEDGMKNSLDRIKSKIKPKKTLLKYRFYWLISFIILSILGFIFFKVGLSKEMTDFATIILGIGSIGSFIQLILLLTLLSTTQSTLDNRIYNADIDYNYFNKFKFSNED